MMNKIMNEVMKDIQGTLLGKWISIKNDIAKLDLCITDLEVPNDYAYINAIETCLDALNEDDENYYLFCTQIREDLFELITINRNLELYMHELKLISSLFTSLNSPVTLDTIINLIKESNDETNYDKSFIQFINLM